MICKPWVEETLPLVPVVFCDCQCVSWKFYIHYFCSRPDRRAALSLSNFSATSQQPPGQRHASHSGVQVATLIDCLEVSPCRHAGSVRHCRRPLQLRARAVRPHSVGWADLPSSRLFERYGRPLQKKQTQLRAMCEEYNIDYTAADTCDALRTKLYNHRPETESPENSQGPRRCRDINMPGLSRLTKEQLRNLAITRNVDISPDATKEEMKNALYNLPGRFDTPEFLPREARWRSTAGPDEAEGAGSEAAWEVVGEHA